MYKQLFYDIRSAYEEGVRVHPQEQMKNLGYECLDAAPQSLYDGWWFTVKDFIEPLPSYLTKMEYNFEYWHNDCWKDCEYFKIAKGNGSLCCYGGTRCIKEKSEQEIKQLQDEHERNAEFHKKYKIDKIISAELITEDGTKIPIKSLFDEK